MTQRVDLWFCIRSARGCRTYHRTVSQTNMLDELKAKLTRVTNGIRHYRPNLLWFDVDSAKLDSYLRMNPSPLV